MTIHHIKLERRFAMDVYDGNKKAEIRYNDRLYQKDDIIKFDIVENGIEIEYRDLRPVELALKQAEFIITYVATADCLASNYVVLSIQREDE